MKKKMLQILKKTFSCPKIDHAVGLWREKKDFILACNKNSIFCIDIEQNILVLNEEKNKILFQNFSIWQRCLPQLNTNVIIANFYVEFCKTDKEEYFLTSHDPKRFFCPTSFFFKFNGILGAAFIDHSTKIVLLFREKIIISKCDNWWQKEELSLCNFINDANYQRIVAHGKRFIVYGEHNILCYNCKGDQLWKKSFEKIRVVWFFESGFTTAILFCNGNIILLNSDSGKILLQESYAALAVESDFNTHVIVKNSQLGDCETAFYILSQSHAIENVLWLTTIDEISFHKKESDFVAHRQIVFAENRNKKLCLSKNN